MNKNPIFIKEYEKQISQLQALVKSDQKIIHLQETQIQLMEEVIRQKNEEITLLNEKYEELAAASKEMQSFFEPLNNDQ